MKKFFPVFIVLLMVMSCVFAGTVVGDEGSKGKGSQHGHGGEGNLDDMEDFRGGQGAQLEAKLMPDQSPEELGIIRLTYSNSNAEHPMFSPDGTQIAYMYREERGSSYTSEIHVMELDYPSYAGGTPVVTADYALTDLDDQCAHLEGWSPDGTQIIFRSSDDVTDARNNLWLVDADGSGAPQPLTFEDDDDACFGGGRGVYQTSFSPDGSQILYSLGYDDAGTWTKEIYVMDNDGTNVVQLTNTLDECEVSPRWSPDGSQIVYRKCGYHDSIANLWVMDNDGSDPHEVVADASANWFGWSPDGEWIVYEYEDDTSPSYHRDIYKVRPDGSDNTRLTPSDEYCEHNPVWGADGTILYRSDETWITEGTSQMSSTWVMRADGSGATMINPYGGKWEDISPNGDWIAFQTCEIASTDDDAEIFIVRSPFAAPLPARRSVGGEVLPVNKLAVAAPWIGLAVLLIGGLTWFTLRRRQAH